jgi:hypothetical protein
LKAILKSKDLLETLEDLRPKLGSAWGARASDHPGPALQELSVLGLIKVNTNISSPTFYVLTDAGHVFLNRLEIQRLNGET